MNSFPPPPPGGQPNGPGLDPRLQPTPDYGTLGPGSDISPFGSRSTGGTPRKASPESVRMLAVVIGIVGALVAVGISRVQPARPGSRNYVSADQKRPATAKDMGQLDRMKPQKQAETLLELAVGQTQGATDQISSRVDRWPGKVQWSPQIASLTSAALNSNDMRVRESGIEVELAAYGLAKNSASFEYLVRAADSPDHRRKIWALWALGLIGNRGVEPERVVDILTSHLKDPDAESRQWAVEGLALTATDQTIDPLLKAMHDDPAPIVRERAACGLAGAGMFTLQQKMSAVPELLNYTDDPTLDAQTHGWAFHALHDITHQQLPNDSAVWREWYQKQVVSD